MIVPFDTIIYRQTFFSKMKINAILLIAALAAIAYAEDISCPAHSKGKHPKCVCDNDKPYDSVNRICAIAIKFKEECPIGSEGIYPHCVCTQGKVYDAIKDTCVESNRSVCPKGAVRVNGKCVCENDVNGYKYALDEVFWICRPWYLQTSTSTTTYRPVIPTPRCPYHQSGEYPHCTWDPCPSGYAGDFWPHCTTCGAHQIGFPPNCEWLPCPKGWKTKTGYFPDCYAPPSCHELGNCPATCPPYTHFVNGKCEKIPCRGGTIGQFEPNCKFLPECPAEYPGIWPNCNIYLANATTTLRTTSTTRSTTQSTTRSTTTTTTAAPVCSCQCRSNEIVAFIDGKVINPSSGERKYARFN